MSRWAWGFKSSARAFMNALEQLKRYFDNVDENGASKNASAISTNLGAYD